MRVRTMGALALGLAACSPALDWREVRPEGSGVLTLFPCKPALQSRNVLLLGQTVRLSLAACSAAGATWALAYADVADPARVGPALDELRRSAAQNLNGSETVRSPLAVKGATPNEAAARARITGRLPDGRAVQEEVAVFSHGTRVLQATVLAETLAPDAVETFFGALRVGP